MNIANLIKTIEDELFDDLCEMCGASHHMIDAVYLYDAVHEDLEYQAVTMLSGGGYG